MLSENFKIALRAILANKMRSILTVLGVMVGVASVIAVVSLVQGLQHKISADLESIGVTFMRVVPDFSGFNNPLVDKIPELTYEDAIAVRKGATVIRDFTPIFINNSALRHGDARHTSTMYGVSSTYQEVVNRWVDHGRFFTPLDEEAKKRVCVVGPEVARRLHLGSEPVGKLISIDGNAYTVIGVMEKRGGSIGGDEDDNLLIPFNTAIVMYGQNRMKHLPLLLQIRSRDDVDLAKEQVTDILRARHRLKKGDPDDFRITTQEEAMTAVSSVLLGVTGIMAAVVGVALLVGGIGIMNIMLVSVTERTREIGIRKSLGARRRDVLLQFLIEAIALSGLGGAVGVVGGFVLANATRMLLKKWFELPPVHTPWWSVVLAVSFCAFLGIIFGVYPAAKASKLDPIEALRYE